MKIKTGTLQASKILDMIEYGNKSKEDGKDTANIKKRNGAITEFSECKAQKQILQISA